MTTVEMELPDEATLADIETTEEKLAVLAKANGKSPAEMRAMFWRNIANADGTESMDGEEIYADVVDQAYNDVLDAAREQLDMALGSELGGSEATAKASAPDSDPVELYGTGLQDEPELTDRQIEAAKRFHERTESDEGSSESWKRFGTGLQGDTTGEDYREREEEIETMAEAIRRAKDTDTEE